MCTGTTLRHIILPGLVSLFLVQTLGLAHNQSIFAHIGKSELLSRRRPPRDLLHISVRAIRSTASHLLGSLFNQHWQLNQSASQFHRDLNATLHSNPTGYQLDWNSPLVDIDNKFQSCLLVEAVSNNSSVCLFALFWLESIYYRLSCN